MSHKKNKIFATIFFATIIATSRLSAMNESMDLETQTSQGTKDVPVFGHSFTSRYLPITQYFYENGLPKEIIHHIFSPLLKTISDFITRYKLLDPCEDFAIALIVLLKEFRQSCSVDLMTLMLLESEYNINALSWNACLLGEIDVTLLCLKVSEEKSSKAYHAFLCECMLNNAINHGHKEIVIACIKSAGPLAHKLIPENYCLFSFDQREHFLEIIKILDFVKQSKRPELLDEYLATLTAEPIVVTAVIVPDGRSTKRSKAKCCIVQ